MPGIGILGGSFNPIHNGHIHIAQQVREKLDLERIFLVPTGIPPHKPKQNLAAPRHRYAMALIASFNLRDLEVSDMEVRRKSTSYTIDTVRQFKAQLRRKDIYLILGTDSVADLHTWKNAERLVWESEPVVVARPGLSTDLAVTSLENHFRPKSVERLLDAVLRIPQVQVSGTEIRRRLGCGEPVRGLVRYEVEQYIRAHGLYGTAAVLD